MRREGRTRPGGPSREPISTNNTIRRDPNLLRPSWYQTIPKYIVPEGTSVKEVAAEVTRVKSARQALRERRNVLESYRNQLNKQLQSIPPYPTSSKARIMRQIDIIDEALRSKYLRLPEPLEPQRDKHGRKNSPTSPGIYYYGVPVSDDQMAVDYQTRMLEKAGLGKNRTWESLSDDELGALLKLSESAKYRELNLYFQGRQRNVFQSEEEAVQHEKRQDWKKQTRVYKGCSCCIGYRVDDRDNQKNWSKKIKGRGNELLWDLSNSNW
ncbi:hypothetical protein HDU96_008998 [Phlyctochytrium bullatum]|nr:hypothetical protein HDU96_008998 [Phlyctochytrium bullatum]